MTIPASMTRLFLQGSPDDSDSQPRTFTSWEDVAAVFGPDSNQAGLAKQFFDGDRLAGQAQFVSMRMGLGNRCHLMNGDNLADWTPPQMAAVSGSISMQFDGLTYSGIVAGGAVMQDQTTALADLASRIQAALDSNTPDAGQLTGTITPVDYQFEGYGYKQNVTDLSTVPHLVPGGIVSSIGNTSGNIGLRPNQIMYIHNGNQGACFYGTHGMVSGVPERGYGSVADPKMIQEKYGVLHVKSGSAFIGEELSGPKVPKGEVISAQLGDGDYVVDLPASTSGPFTGGHTTLTCSVQQIWSGYAELNISSDPFAGLDEVSSTMTSASGAVADALGFEAGASLLQGQGGQGYTKEQFMANVLNEAPAFTSYQDINGADMNVLGAGYTWIDTTRTTPAADAAFASAYSRPSPPVPGFENTHLAPASTAHHLMSLGGSTGICRVGM